MTSSTISVGWILILFGTVLGAHRFSEDVMMEFPDLNFNEDNNYLTEFFGPSSTINQPSFVIPPRTTSGEKNIVTYTSEHESSDEKSQGNENDEKKSFHSHMNEYEPYHSHHHHHHQQQNNDHHHHHHSHHHEERVPVAVLSYHHHKYVEVPEHHVHYKPTIIDLNGKMYPIMLQFNSHSSPLITTHRHHHHHQNHYEETSHVDEPHHHVHTIRKPIIQEVREIITPYKNVFRVVKPMKENVRTYIHKHNKYHHGHHSHGHHYTNSQDYSDDSPVTQTIGKTIQQTTQTLPQQQQQQQHQQPSLPGPNPKYSFDEQQPKFTFENQGPSDIHSQLSQATVESNF